MKLTRNFEPDSLTLCYWDCSHCNKPGAAGPGLSPSINPIHGISTHHTARPSCSGFPLPYRVLTPIQNGKNAKSQEKDLILAGTATVQQIYSMSSSPACLHKWCNLNHQKTEGCWGTCSPQTAQAPKTLLALLQYLGVLHYLCQFWAFLL